MTAKEKKAFRARGHHLKPVVLVGKEQLSPAVVGAIDAALTTHELIKVKLLDSCTVEKNDAARLMSVQTGAALIQRIGRTVLLYRPRPDEDE